MPSFTQKYTIVQLIEDLPDGYEYSMKDWPLHVTLADVFAIDGVWTDLLKDLERRFKSQATFFSDLVANDLFGEYRSIKVKLLRKTDELQKLHDNIIRVLERHDVAFNSPQYTKAGFKPHLTEQSNGSLHIGDIVELRSITLIDMFPNEDPYRRKVLGTIRFS